MPDIASETQAALDFWSAFKSLLEGNSNTQNLGYQQSSATRVLVTTKDGRALHVNFSLDDGSLPRLKYELEDGKNDDFQFVFAGKAYFRNNGVNYSVESLRKRLFSELLEPR